ncbi:MAG: universal stress protein [Gemmatimonadota bacterium]|nr:universal stress protein [Gemmatimonadota bacterium]
MTQSPDTRRKFQVVLLASDGSPAMDATIGIAQRLAERDAATVRVVTAVEPLPMVTPEGNLPLVPEIEASRHEALERHVREQLVRCAPGASAQWTVQQIDGRPDATIARVAQEIRADLIVLGLGEHGMIDRWFGGETALRVLRLVRTPVLAVAPAAAGLPRRVVAATDFSATSERALAAALAFLDAGVKLELVHVVPRDISMGVWPAWDDAYENAVRASFADLRSRVALPAGVDVDEVILYGDPANELLNHAERTRADVIVTGTHGHGAITAAMLGRVSTKLIRGARCSVFAVPPETRAS